MGNQELSNSDREKLYECYETLCETLETIKGICRHTRGWDRAKGYWFASLSQGLSDSEYPTLNETFESFLKANDIIDDDNEFIDELEDDDDREDFHSDG